MLHTISKKKKNSINFEWFKKFFSEFELFCHITNRIVVVVKEREMGRGGIDYLAMRSDAESGASLGADVNELKAAAKKVLSHAAKLGGLAFGTCFLGWVSSSAAMSVIKSWWWFCVVNWMLTKRCLWIWIVMSGAAICWSWIGQIGEATCWLHFSSLTFSWLCPTCCSSFWGDRSIMHLIQSKPSCFVLTNDRYCRGEVGKWIALIAVVLRLFFPRHFPEWVEMPGSLILLLVVSPEMFAESIRGEWMGAGICVAIGCYLLQEHIRASGGFRNSFTQRHGISNTIGIVLLLLFPIWDLLSRLLWTRISISCFFFCFKLFISFVRSPRAHTNLKLLIKFSFEILMLSYYYT